VKLELENGVVVEVEDRFLELSEDDQQQVLREITGQTGSDKMSVGEVMGDVGRQMMQKSQQGFYGDFLGLPATLLNLPIAGADMAGKAMGMGGVDFRFPTPYEANPGGIFVEEQEPKTGIGRYAGAAARFGSGSLPMTATGIGAATRAAQVAQRARPTQEIARAANPKQAASLRDLAKPGNAGRALRADAAISPVAGIGGEAGHDVAPMFNVDPETGRVIGAIGAGLAAPFTPTRLVAKGVVAGAKGVARRVPFAGRKMQTEKAKDFVRRAMEIGPDDVDALAKAEALQAEFPGLKLSLAEILGDSHPALVASHRAFTSRLGPTKYNAERARQQGNLDAVAARQRQLQPDETPLDAFDDLRQSASGDEARRLTIENRVAQEMSDLDATTTPATRPVDRGATIQETFQTRLEDVKAQLGDGLVDGRQKYPGLANELGLNSKIKDIPLEDIAKSFRDAATAAPGQGPHTTPSYIIRQLNDELAKGSKVSIDYLLNIRKQMGEAIRRAQKPGMEVERKNLTRGKTAFDDATDKALVNMGDKRAQDLPKWRNQWDEEIVQRYGTGMAGKVMAMETPDAIEAGLFVPKTGQSYARALKAGAGGPELDSAVRDAAIANLKKTLFKRSGDIDPTALDAWKKRYPWMSEEFPDLADELGDIGTTVRRVVESNVEQTAKLADIEIQTLFEDVRHISGSLRNPESILADAMTNERRMRALAKTLKTPEGKRGLTRHVWNVAMTQADPADYILKHGDVIKHAMAPESAEAMMKIARAYKMAKAAPMGPAQEISAGGLESIEDFVGTGMNQLSSRLFAAASGRTSYRYIALDMMSRFVRGYSRREAAKLFEEALLNPKIAEDIAETFARPRAEITGLKNLQTWLVETGLVAMEGEPEYNPLRVPVNPMAPSRTGGE
jgi:hypothetical protein